MNKTTMPTREEIFDACNKPYMSDIQAVIELTGMLRRIADAMKDSVVVPKKPTDAMFKAASEWCQPVWNDASIGCWAAMLAAAQGQDHE